MMRAREFISEYITPSTPVTLRSLNLLNRQKRKHDAEYEWRTKVLMPAMYGHDHPDDIKSERRALVLDHREIALDKREAELELIQQRLEQSTGVRDAIRKMAKHAIESDDA
jgi:hypothetical protein